MPDVGRIAIKDIFLELLYNVEDTTIIDANALCNVITAFSYDFIKGIIWELHSDGIVCLKNEKEYNYFVHINDKGKQFKENGGYVTTHRAFESELEKAKFKAINSILFVADTPNIIHNVITDRKFSLARTPILKPLFRFKKYKIAGLLLKIAVHHHATAIYRVDENLVKHKMYEKTYGSYPISNFLEGNPKLKPERVLEAVDILTDAKHVIKSDNHDIYKLTIKATPVGERAYNDGYYIEQATQTAWKTFGAIIGGGVLIFSAIKWLIPLLLQLL